MHNKASQEASNSDNARWHVSYGRQSCHLFNCCPVLRPWGSTNNWELKRGSKKKKTHHPPQSLYSFQAAGHCPQCNPIFAPRAFYKSHRLPSSFYKWEHKGERGLGRGHQARLCRSQKQTLSLVCLACAPPPSPFWLDLAGYRCWHVVGVTSQPHLH